MNEEAAHLVDRVLPRAPYRQWVLTLPGEVARVMAFDAPLTSAIFRALAEEVARWQQAAARTRGIDAPEAGSVLQIQRFADGCGLYVHAHMLAPEGVFHERPDGTVHFHRLPPPRQADVEALVVRMEHRVRRILRRRDDTASEDDDDRAVGVRLLDQCAATPVAETICVEGASTPRRASAAATPLCARSPAGLELHAAVQIDAPDRAGLERVCRYLARPAVPQDRVSYRADGKVVVTLKRVWKGGVRAVVFEPLTFLARLAALVPAPYQNQRRFYGLFAARHRLRARVVPTSSPPGADLAAAPPVAPRRPARMGWADLLRRVWNIDALRCDDCGGRLRPIAVVHDPDAITAILAALHASPHRTSDTARAPPALEGWCPADATEA